MNRIEKIRLLRGQSGLPYHYCATWARTMPESFFLDLLDGEPYQAVLLKLAAEGIELPCPVCEAPLEVFLAYCGCTDRSCGYVAWWAFVDNR